MECAMSDDDKRDERTANASACVEAGESPVVNCEGDSWRPELSRAAVR